MLDVNTKKLVWLSHILDVKTPTYGNKTNVEVVSQQCMEKGDRCNSISISLPNHVGSHVDCPLHFYENAKSILDYDANDWVFNKPLVIDVLVNAKEIITVSHIQAAIFDQENDIDLILFRTGFEKYRQEDAYWQDSPAFDSELCTYLTQQFPRLRAIGMDVISLTSLHHRELGREAHLKFLQADIRIFEDLSLCAIENDISLDQVIALPLRIYKADGAPCTIIGVANEAFS